MHTAATRPEERREAPFVAALSWPDGVRHPRGRGRLARAGRRIRGRRVRTGAPGSLCRAQGRRCEPVRDSAAARLLARRRRAQRRDRLAAGPSLRRRARSAAQPAALVRDHDPPPERQGLPDACGRRRRREGRGEAGTRRARRDVRLPDRRAVGRLPRRSAGRAARSCGHYRLPHPGRGDAAGCGSHPSAPRVLARLRHAIEARDGRLLQHVRPRQGGLHGRRAGRVGVARGT